MCGSTFQNTTLPKLCVSKLIEPIAVVLAGIIAKSIRIQAGKMRSEIPKSVDAGRKSAPSGMKSIVFARSKNVITVTHP
jgi:hypothetical protein